MDAPELIALTSTALLLLGASVLAVTLGGAAAMVGAIVALRRVRSLAPLAHELDALEARARRLRLKSDRSQVAAPPLADGLAYHIFLSHVWSHGQDAVRVMKQRARPSVHAACTATSAHAPAPARPHPRSRTFARAVRHAPRHASGLLEMVPGLCVFLDVDDLADIGGLEAYIAKSHTVLVCCSEAYFRSRNCMIELHTAARLGKAMVNSHSSTDTSRPPSRRQPSRLPTRAHRAHGPAWCV